MTDEVEIDPGKIKNFWQKINPKQRLMLIILVYFLLGLFIGGWTMKLWLFDKLYQGCVVCGLMGVV